MNHLLQLKFAICRFRLLLIIAFCISFLAISWSQAILLIPKNPIDAEICKESNTGLIIYNRSGNTLTDLLIDLRLPAGIAYLPSTITGAIENNITNLSTPQFLITQLRSNDSIEIRLRILPSCKLIPKINMNELFANQWYVNSILGLDSIPIAENYAVRTGFLLIDDLVDTTVLTGSSFKRRIKITNTGLGSIRNFIFEDKHDPLIINANGVRILIANDTFLRIAFDEIDFLKIGDRDSLFERNESIEFLEEIDESFCQPRQVRSFLNAYWGCDGDTCQNYFESVVIDFFNPNEPAKFKPFIDEKFPTCICTDTGTTQCLTLINTGKQIAENIIVRLYASEIPQSTNPFGILRGSVNVSGDAMIIDTIYNENVDPSGDVCNTTNGYRDCIIRISELAPGEEFKISFDYMTCLECINPGESLFWNYDFEFNTKCIPNSKEMSVNKVEVKNPDGKIAVRNQFISSNGLAEDGGIYTVKNFIIFEKRVTNKHLIITYTIPCPFRLVDSSFLLNGKAPISKTITDGDSTIRITLVYPPQFSDTMLSEYKLRVDCDFLCRINLNGISNTQFYSTCPNPRVSIVNLLGAICIEALLTCPQREYDCGLCPGNFTTYRLQCPEFDTERDTILGYLTGNIDTYRKNYGSPDANDDRFEEIGVLDTALAERKKFTTGDTMIHDFRTAATVENTNLHFDSCVFMVIYDPLMTFDTVYSEITIHDKSENKIYKCIYPVSGRYRSIDSLLSCEETSIFKLNYGNGMIVPFNTEQLNKYGAGLPSNFKYEDGDSINAKIYCRIINFIGERIELIKLNYYAFLFDRKALTNPYSCINSNDTIYQVTLRVHHKQKSEKLYVCKSEIVLPLAEIKGSDELINFFTHEHRNLFSLDSIRLYIDPVNPNLILDSFRISYWYETKNTMQLIKSLVLPVRYNSKLYWEIDPELLKNHEYDETYTIRLQAFLHLTECADFNSLNTLITTRYYINANNNLFLTDHSTTIAVDSVIYSNINTIYLFNGNDSINIKSKTLFGSSERIQWSLPISNLLLSGGFEFTIYSPNNSLSGIILDPLGNATIKQLDSLRFEVRNLDAFQNYLLQFRAKHNYCKRDSFYIYSRWLCISDSIVTTDHCNIDTILMIIDPDQPELMFDVQQKSFESLLCDTMPQIELEIFNADKGVACDLYLEANIPPGVSIVPNSPVYRYPNKSGNTYRPLPAPDTIGSNLYRWTFADFIQEIKQNCLMGIDSTGLNSIGIKLQLSTACNATINSYPTFFTTANNHCGDAINSLSQTSQLIRIKGISLPGAFTLKMSKIEPGNCSDTASIQLSMLKSSLTLKSDSIKIILPNELTYISGSMNPISNIFKQEPIIVNESNQLALYFALTEGIPATDSISFSILVRGLKQILCSDEIIRALTYTRASSFCTTTQSNCDVFVQSGSAEILLKQKTGSFNLDSFKLIELTDSNFQLQFHYHVQDKDKFLDQIIRIGLYADSDHNGLLSGPDLLIRNLLIDIKNISNDSIITFIEKIFKDSLTGCNFILTAIADNCICGNDTLYANILRTAIFFQSDSICAGDNILIGKNNVIGKIYNWFNGNVNCDTCSQFNFISSTSQETDTIYRFSLRESDSLDCPSEYAYELKVFANPNGRNFYFESCPNQLIEFDAGQRQNFQWQGEPLTDIFKYNQSIQNTTDRLILLNFSDHNTCKAIDSFFFRTLIDTSPIFLLGDSIIIVAPGTIVKYCISGGKFFLWEPAEGLNCTDCPCVEINVDHNTEYFITVYDSFNCPHQLQLRVQVLQPPCDSTNIFLPNAFSPNQDQRNDTLFVKCLKLNDIPIINRMNFAIYNRWGEKVFESFNVLHGWDGTYKDKLLTPDVFGYYLDAECIDGQHYFRKGNVSLLR